MQIGEMAGIFQCIFLTGTLVALAGAAPITNEVYSLDNLSEDGKILSITVDPDTKDVLLTQFNVIDGEQRVILRKNSDSTFTIFPDTQPWNWVDHILESTKFIRILKVPQVLTAVGGTKQVIEQNYKGKSQNSQNWYLVPTGEDSSTGVLTNSLLRLCLTGQGENQPVTIATCNWSDPNQIFTISLRTSGRRT